MKMLLAAALLWTGAAQAAPCSQPGEGQAAYRQGAQVRNAHDAALALRWFERAAACQVAAAMFTLSNMLAAGEGTAPDAARARRWLEAAAALDHPEALQQLAMEEPDARKAELLMRRAAHALMHR